MAKRRGNYGPYKMTARRRYALKKAQEASARKRRRNRNKKIGAAAGAIAGLAVAGYLGHRYGSSAIKASARNNMRIVASRNVASRNARRAVNPAVKEVTRTANAVSVAPPSRTTSAKITDADRLRAEHARAKLARKLPAPAHMRGATDAQTNRSVRRTLREAKKATQGKKSPSLTGTPGGTKTPMNAIPHKPETWKDEDWADALAFDMSVNRPLSGGSPGGGRGTMGTPQRDPLHTLAKMRYDDSKLLGTPIRSGDTDHFLSSAGTSREGPKRKKGLKPR